MRHPDPQRPPEAVRKGRKRPLRGGYLLSSRAPQLYCVGARELPRSCGVLYRRPSGRKENVVTLGTILLIILILLLIGALPTWPYSRGWGYYPTGGLGLILIIILILVLMGRI